MKKVYEIIKKSHKNENGHKINAYYVRRKIFGRFYIYVWSGDAVFDKIGFLAIPLFGAILFCVFIPLLFSTPKASSEALISFWSALKSISTTEPPLLLITYLLGFKKFKTYEDAEKLIKERLTIKVLPPDLSTKKITTVMTVIESDNDTISIKKPLKA